MKHHAVQRVFALALSVLLSVTLFTQGLSAEMIRFDETTAPEETIIPAESTAPEETIIPAGSTASEALVTAADTASGVEGFVERLYRIALNRGADPTGYQNWLSQLTSHTATGISVAYGFVFSPEFIGRNLCDSDYVESLYQLFLGRGSDPSGKANWVSQLAAGASRQSVFGGFANSDEFGAICGSYGILQGYYQSANNVCASAQVTCFVERLYSVCLGRSGENAGVTDWTRQILEGRNTGAGVAFGFFFSQEYLNKAPSYEQYVTALYRAFLGRDPDPSGKANWVVQLELGASMESIFAGFANSGEYGNICSSYGISRGNYCPSTTTTILSAENPFCSIQIGDKTLTLYQSVTSLLAAFGTPTRIDPTEYGYSFYVYSSDYSNLLYVAVRDNKVDGWYTDATSVCWNGLTRYTPLSAVPFTEGAKSVIANHTLLITSDPEGGSTRCLDTFSLLPRCTTPQPNASVVTAYEQTVFELTNSYRVHHGLSALAWSSTAATVARNYSLYMPIFKIDISHTGLDASTPRSRMEKAGINMSCYGENIAAGQSSPFAVMDGWKNSAPHRANLLQPSCGAFRYLGVGYAYVSGSTYIRYWTQDFYG